MNTVHGDEVAIVIADDHAMVRGGLRRIIDGEAGLRVAGEASDGTGTLERLRDTRCDVLLLDLGMPPPSGPELVRQVRARHPDVAVLVLSMHNDPRVVRAALAAGANGYVSKDSDPDVLLAALRTVAAGGHYVESRLANALLFSLPPAPHDSLSPREQQVLRRLARGQSNAEIARELFLSEKTVSTHKANLMAKLRLRNMAELVRYADQHLATGTTDSVGEPKAGSETRKSS